MKFHIKKQKKEEIKNNFYFLQGTKNEKDIFSPGYINLTNPRYLEIEECYFSGLLIVNYYREYDELILKNLIDTNTNMNISIFYEKQDIYQTIRDLTYHIGNTSVDLENKNKNDQEIDLVAFSYNDAKYIRREMQVNNQHLYFLYIYLLISSKEKRELEYLLNKIEGICEASGMQTKKANFRQAQVFASCMPIMENSKEIKTAARRNILTEGMIATYPFISSSIFDEEGVFIGSNIYNNSLVFVDRYCTEKYKNANMCVFGTSGAGKSFYIKLLAIRYRLLGIEQFIIDPDREYDNICTFLGGTILKIGPSCHTYINIFDIREESLEESTGYLANKIPKLIGFFNLIFGELNEEEKAILEEAIIFLYQEKGITFDDKSLYKGETEIFKSTKDMPILEEFYDILGKKENTKKMQIKLIPFVKGSLAFFNQYTNIELHNSFIVADVYDLGEENLKYGMYLFTEIFWDKIKKDRTVKKAIYLDEVWRLIGVTSNKEVASFIYKIFKTIRKYGGSSIAITQDVSDLFSLEGGVFGKSILNNSSIKTFFALEEENILLLSQYTNLSEKEKIEIKSLKRGECLMFVGEEHILVKIEAAEFEKEIIEQK